MFEQLLAECKELIESSEYKLSEKLNHICQLLFSKLDNYDWVGFYFSNLETKMLHLKAFSGPPTEHTVIPFGKGICGQVALNNKNFIVDDVSKQTNYISCSITVKSEIVVPIFANGINIGQIDIDSNTLAAFNKEDEQFLTRLANLVSTLYKTT